MTSHLDHSTLRHPQSVFCRSVAVRYTRSSNRHSRPRLRKPPLRPYRPPVIVRV